MELSLTLEKVLHLEVHFLLQLDVMGTEDWCYLTGKEMKGSVVQAFTAVPFHSLF
jgi:hypothetical protein